jgi:hypothetical protein
MNSPEVIQVGHSYKEIKLRGLEFGKLLDDVVKMVLPRTASKVYINMVVVFDGISLGKLDINTDVRNRITVRNVGKVSLGSSSKLNKFKKKFLTWVPNY